LPSGVDTSSPEFKENKQAMDVLVSDLNKKVEKIRQGGGQKAKDKHIARKKLLVRDRIDRLLDPG